MNKPMRLSLFNNEEEPEVSMSPLIDCVFLLLIFFLVSTMTKVKNRDIPVDLPTSQSAIRIDMDRHTPFGRFVEVMDACQFYNLSNIGIRTYDENYNRE